MDYTQAGLVVCLTLFLVVGLNAMIYVSVMRKKTVGQFELMRRAMQRAKNPWQQDNQEMQELGKLVAEIKGRGDRDPE